MQLLSNLEFVIAFAVAVALLLALLLTYRERRGLRHELRQLGAQLVRAESQAREQTRMMARMRSEKGTVASLALSLPHVVQALNRGDLNPRRVPQLILNLVDAIFQPGQVLYWAARYQAAPGEGIGELHLITHYGLAEVPDPLRRIRFGTGKVGWVAEHRVDMLAEDWLNPNRTGNRRVEDNHPVLRPEIVGPLVHHGVEGPQLLGVLSIGQLGIRPRDEKLMFQLVTNLGSLALVNAQHVTQLRERANTDGLTGMLNKGYFLDELLGRMIFTAERERQVLSLLIFDLDHFKTYNDTNGHPAGDRLLRELAELVQQRVRPGDVCCRYGGEEFIVAMPETDGDEAFRIAERVRKVIEHHPFAHRRRQPLRKVTISGGVAVFPHDGNSVHELTSHADMALYESKRLGRNRITRYRGVSIGDADDATGFDLIPAGDDNLPV